MKVSKIDWLMSGFFILIHAVHSMHAGECSQRRVSWEELSKNTVSLSDASEFRKLLNEKAPGFLIKLEHDGSNKKLLGLWGLSHNIDESNLAAGTLTVPENVLRFFNSLWNVPYNSQFTVGHAGLTHTYGYLFSNLPTPYGFKRARYVDGDLEEGFGLPRQLFEGIPPQGTLLMNFTYLAGKIAFRDRKNALDELAAAARESEEPIPSALVHVDYLNLHIQRITETVLKEGASIELHTDLVQFPHSTRNGKNNIFLIYSVITTLKNQSDLKTSVPQLITAFPISTLAAEKTLEDSPQGQSVSIQSKYNLALPEPYPSGPWMGSRTLH